jgi:hypothetical protein
MKRLKNWVCCLHFEVLLGYYSLAPSTVFRLPTNELLYYDDELIVYVMLDIKDYFPMLIDVQVSGVFFVKCDIMYFNSEQAKTRMSFYLLTKRGRCYWAIWGSSKKMANFEHGVDTVERLIHYWKYQCSKWFKVSPNHVQIIY